MDQTIAIRVTEAKPIRSPRTTTYRCEVISADSPYFERIDFLYSTEDLRPAHSYEVRLNDAPESLTIIETIQEIGTEEHTESQMEGDSDQPPRND